VAWWHCGSGIAGDMALGSLIDAGADPSEIRRELTGLELDGWSLEAVPVTRAGLAATQAVVTVADDATPRRYRDVVRLLTGAHLAERPRQRALAVFARLAEVEGRLHRTAPDEVHFHEVGALDAIVDVVGTCVALELLGVDLIQAGPVAQGVGSVQTAHGTLPVPAPAVVELLRGAPVVGTSSPLELTTPTGAALLAALSSGWGPVPAMTVSASGYGAGRRDTPGRPNALQVIVGVATEPLDERWSPGTDGGQPVMVVETNVDDVTGELLAHTVAAALQAGAHDAWITPVTGKKGRPAHVVSVLVEPALLRVVAELLVNETGTLGVRAYPLRRWPAPREVIEVDVDGQPVRVKRSPQRVKAEHDDAVRAGAVLGRPVREVAAQAESLARKAP
jgi:uncharacterized protein (TIGR00299 family) protein